MVSAAQILKNSSRLLTPTMIWCMNWGQERGSPLPRRIQLRPRNRSLGSGSGSLSTLLRGHSIGIWSFLGFHQILSHVELAAQNLESLVLDTSGDSGNADEGRSTMWGNYSHCWKAQGAEGCRREWGSAPPALRKKQYIDNETSARSCLPIFKTEKYHL